MIQSKSISNDAGKGYLPSLEKYRYISDDCALKDKGLCQTSMGGISYQSSIQALR